MAVDILLKDGVLILHNGKSEVGPRALGDRSFIARPDKLEVKKKLSEKIKQREPYRPVAPVVLEEKTREYFTGPEQSPFMLYRYEVVGSQAEKIIGAVHIDNSARVQTINRDANPFLYDLVKAFGDRTGIYVVLNTSLNLKGEPLTNKIQESLDIYENIDGPKGIIYDGELIKSS
jgi:carbamoyltransferase